MQLELVLRPFHRVRRGQTLAQIAHAFCVPPALLAAENALKGPPEEGELLHIPDVQRHLYRVQGGDSMSALCGSRARFLQQNGCEILYPTQIVCL